MPYRFAQERRDASDFATGNVLESLPGHTAFPVRLADELFQRCLAVRRAAGLTAPVVLYDPCCGGAALLVTLAFLHGSHLRGVIGSDADPGVLPLATRNLALLTPAGMAARRARIADLAARFGKASHAAALESAARLAGRLPAHPINTHLFLADAGDPSALRATLGEGTVDVIITDTPYGQRSTWLPAGQGQPDAANPLGRLLAAVLPVLAPGAVVVVVTDKAAHARHPAYSQVGRLQIGKRRAVLLVPCGSA